MPINWRTKVHLFDGWEPKGRELETPLWSGAFEEFCEANSDGLLWCEVQLWWAALRSGRLLCGGGSTPQKVLMTEAHRALRFAAWVPEVQARADIPDAAAEAL